MTRGRHAAGCISHSISSQPANFIWISDAVLTQTFSRFCRLQRRHGSCVPGPLEARRRASRRKTTNLASPTWGEAFTIPSELIESGAQPAAWWQNAVRWSADQSMWFIINTHLQTDSQQLVTLCFHGCYFLPNLPCQMSQLLRKRQTQISCPGLRQQRYRQI